MSNVTVIENNPKCVYLHCLATPDNDNSGIGSDDVKKWHTDPAPHGNGWKRSGYHYVVKRSGVIESLVPEHLISNGIRGHNSDALHVAYAGTFYPSEHQVVSLVQLALMFKKERGLGARDWFGHYERDNGKKCPGFSMMLFRSLLKAHKI